MKKSGKTKGYEVVSASLTIPLAIEPTIETKTNAQGDLIKPDLKKISFTRASGFVPSIDMAIIHTQEKLSACSRFIDEGNFSKFRQIIQEQPQLLKNEWVSKQAHCFRNRSSTARGRPAGIHSINPSLIVSFVNAAISTGQAANREQAFHVVGAFMGFSYEVMKRHFYNAMKHSCFQTTMVETGKPRAATAEDMQKLASAQSIFSK